MVTADEIQDPHALHIWTTVNGRIMQDANTVDMVFDIAALLDTITAAITLEPGDVVSPERRPASVVSVLRPSSSPMVTWSPSASTVSVS